MEEEGGGASGSEEVVQLEEAVGLLVEHLVAPVLPLGQVDREVALLPETQKAVARQVHATVLLYNYYHRKQFPQLEFASPYRFCMSASLTVSNKNLLMYVNQVQNSLGNGVGAGAGLSITDKAIMDACDIAEALDPTKDSPEMIMWPISMVAVLLLNRTKKVCLLEHSSETQGVLSMFEKDIETALCGSLSSDMSVQGLSNKSMAHTCEPYVLQQIAYSEVELKTGIKRTNLRFIEEHRVYSLSKKGTATMLFLLHYDQTVDSKLSKLKEMPLDALIERMSGPIFQSSPYLGTTSVVECYHLLPYKEVLLNVLNRDWPLGSSQSAPKGCVFQNGKSSPLSEIDESLKEQEAISNSNSKMKKITTDVSTPKKNKQVVKAVVDSGINNCSTSKNRKESNMNCKRKSEAFNTKVATYPGHGDDQSSTKDLQASVQMDKKRTEKNSKSRNVPQITPVKNITQDADPVINDHALKNQNEKVTEKSGGITGNLDVQKYAALQLLRKRRDDTLREHFLLGDRSAEYEMEIQTILTETEMTPKVTSILKKYENSWKMMEVANPISSGEGCQTMNIKRKKLKEAILLRNRCQELDYICRESNWILPRYRVLPAVTGGMYQASVHLTGPDFNLNADGDMKVTPREARDSAASNMLSQLQQKAMED